ncbi:sugar (Glycoside-Pentoside-Hexuronide) transporter [Raoultella ornithinolytica]|nr:sugar (Glycoside-Pentoside-Hexuronide) transporter [Raoultella ornithinolytica]
MVPYETLATEMTDDFSLRSKLTGYKAIFGKLANFLAAFIPGQFILLYGKDSATPFFLTGLTYGVILIIAISCLWFCSWERPREEDVRVNEKKGLLTTLLIAGEGYAFNLLSTRVPQTSWDVSLRFRRRMAVCLDLYLLRYLCPAARSGDGRRAEQPELDSAAALYGLVYRPVCEKGIQQALYSGAEHRDFLRIAVHLAVVFPSARSSGNHPDVWDHGAVWPGTGGVYYIPWTVYTFLADVDEIYTGRRREGIYAGAMTFSGKILRSIIVFTMGAILSFYGFQSKAHTQPGKRSDRHCGGVL